MSGFHHHGYHVLVSQRNSCDLSSVGKELWDVLRCKSFTHSGRRQLFLLCLHQYLNTSAHPADSLMVRISLDIFPPQANFHPPNPLQTAPWQHCWEQEPSPATLHGLEEPVDK